MAKQSPQEEGTGGAAYFSWPSGDGTRPALQVLRLVRLGRGYHAHPGLILKGGGEGGSSPRSPSGAELLETPKAPKTIFDLK